MIDINRMKQLSGMNPSYKSLQSIMEEREKTLKLYDDLIAKLQQGQQLDEGLFDTLKASVATLKKLSTQGAKVAIDKTSKIAKEVSDKVIETYKDEKSKNELEKMIVNMKSLGDVLYKMGKDSSTIIAKDPEVQKIMVTFDDLFKVTVKDLQDRLLVAKSQ